MKRDDVSEALVRLLADALRGDGDAPAVEGDVGPVLRFHFEGLSVSADRVTVDVPWRGE